jgi:hypothetical protein
MRFIEEHRSPIFADLPLIASCPIDFSAAMADYRLNSVDFPPSRPIRSAARPAVAAG